VLVADSMGLAAESLTHWASKAAPCISIIYCASRIELRTMCFDYCTLSELHCVSKKLPTFILSVPLSNINRLSHL